MKVRGPVPSQARSTRYSTPSSTSVRYEASTRRLRRGSRSLLATSRGTGDWRGWPGERGGARYTLARWPSQSWRSYACLILSLNWWQKNTQQKPYFHELAQALTVYILPHPPRSTSFKKALPQSTQILQEDSVAPNTSPKLNYNSLCK